MGNDAYGLTNMNIFDIPVAASGEAGAADWIIFFDKSGRKWQRRLAPTTTQAEENILDGATVTTAEINYLDITTLGTGAASKAVVLDTGDDYVWPAAGILTYGVLKDPAGSTLIRKAHNYLLQDRSPVKHNYLGYHCRD